MGTLKENFLSLIGKVGTVESNYEKALEKKHTELVETQLDRQTKEVEYKELEKMVLLGQVVESTFDKERTALENLQEKEAKLTKDLQFIQEYKSDDIEKVLAELSKAKSAYVADESDAVTKLRFELMEAKLAYFEKLVEVSNKYEAIAEPERKFQNILVKFGKKRGVYMSDTHDALSMVSVPNGGYINLLVDSHAVFEALAYGRVPYDVKTFVEKGRKQD